MGGAQRNPSRFAATGDGYRVAPTILRRLLPPRRRQLEFSKLDSGSNRAANQGPVAVALGRLPRMRRDNSLRRFTGGEIGAKLHAALSIVVSDLQRQRIARVIMPDLDGIDAMPV